jgi:hypothetical protein
MTGLQEAFYIMGIIFMSVMLILIALLISAVFVIRAKVINIEHNIQHKIDEVTDIASKSGEIAAMVGSKIAGAAAKKVRKTASKIR